MALTLDDIKKMPAKRKALIVALIYFVLGAAYYSLFMQSSLQKKGELDTKLSEIQAQVVEKARLAAQKEKFEKEVNALRETLKVALAKLPDQREIPGLLYAVAQAGKDSGIDFILQEKCAHTRFLFAVYNSPVDGCCPAIFRKERRMKIKRTEFWNCVYFSRQNSKRYDNDEVGCESLDI